MNLIDESIATEFEPVTLSLITTRQMAMIEDFVVNEKIPVIEVLWKMQKIQV